MKITNWQGMAPRQTYRRSLDDFFNDRYRSLLGMGMEEDFSPAINTKEEKEHYELEIATPGLDKKDLQVTVDNGILTVSSKRKETNEQDGDGYLRREFSYRSFSRSLSLPQDVDDERITATYQNGILNINLPRQQMPEDNESERKITIQ